MKANDIKKELKQAGFNTKDFKVSVRKTYDTYINVTIKNPYVNRIEVEKVLNHHESIDYDTRTYEILGGANTFVTVTYECGIFEEPSKQWHVTSLGIIKDERTGFKVFDGLHFIDNQLYQSNEKGSCHRNVCDLKQLSEYLFKYATFGSIDV